MPDSTNADFEKPERPTAHPPCAAPAHGPASIQTRLRWETRLIAVSPDVILATETDPLGRPRSVASPLPQPPPVSSDIAPNFPPPPAGGRVAGSPVTDSPAGRSPVTGSRVAGHPVPTFPADLPPDQPLPASRAHRKTSYRLGHAARQFIRHFRRRHTLFVTLTMADPSRDLAACNRCLSALLMRLRKRLPTLQSIWVADAGASDRLHYHLLVSLPDDVRTGTDFKIFRTPGRPPLAKIRAAVNPAVRAFWDLLEGIATPLGFGRTEVFPLRKMAGAVAGYFEKNYRNLQSRRVVSDKRRRVWGMSAGAPRPPGPNQFSLNHPGSIRHRARMAEAAAQAGISSLDEAAYLVGPRWHHVLASIAYGPDARQRIDRLRRDVDRAGPAMPRLARLRAEADARLVLEHLSTGLDSSDAPSRRRRRAGGRSGGSRARPGRTEASAAGRRRSAATATAAERAGAGGRPQAAPARAGEDAARLADRTDGGVRGGRMRAEMPL